MLFNLVLLLCVEADVTTVCCVSVIDALVLFVIPEINLLCCAPLSSSKTMLSPIFNSVLNLVFLPNITVVPAAISIDPASVIFDLSFSFNALELSTVSAVKFGDPAMPTDLTSANSKLLTAFCVEISPITVPLFVDVPPVTVSAATKVPDTLLNTIVVKIVCSAMSWSPSFVLEASVPSNTNGSPSSVINASGSVDELADIASTTPVAPLVPPDTVSPVVKETAVVIPTCVNMSILKSPNL